MEFGGNKNAKAYYEKNGMLPQGQPPDHKNPALTRYKNELKLKALNALGVEEAQKPAEVAAQPAETIKPKSNIIIMGGQKSEPV